MELEHKNSQGREERREASKKLYIDSTPDVDQGINLVKKPEETPVLQALTAKALAGKDAKAVWADVKNEASTYALAGQRPDLLERVEVGRAFTPFQHHRLIHELEEFIYPDTELLVAPHFPLLYLEGSTNQWESEELFEESWKELKRLQKRHGLKVLVTLPDSGSQLCLKVEVDSEKVIEVEETSSGWKYSSENFETKAYRRTSKIFQTTMRLWEDVEGKRTQKVST